MTSQLTGISGPNKNPALSSTVPAFFLDSTSCFMLGDLLGVKNQEMNDSTGTFVCLPLEGGVG
jgi:hypothetical protein